jgi:tetratricopeptide (TPR) repeat protein
MAVTAAAHGQLDMADRYFRMAYRTWPHDSRFLNEMAGFYSERGDYATAIVYLERSRRITPWAAVTYEILADTYLKAGQPAQAIAYAKQANSLGSKRPFMTFSTMAAAYDRLGQYDRAVGAWRVAAHTPDGGMWLHYGMGARSLAYGHRIEEALATADTAAARTTPGSPMHKAALVLKTAIREGCYAAGPSEPARACDPLQSWTLSTGPRLIGATGGGEAAVRN